MIKEEEILNQALLHHQKGNFQEAQALYGKILQQNPNNDSALYFLGVMMQQLGHFDNAVSYIEKAAEFNPMPDYYKDLGNILFDINKTEEAIKYYSKFIALNPDDLDILYNLGILYYKIKDFNKAINCFEKVLSLNINDIEACNNLVNVLFDLGTLLVNKKNLSEAILCYKKAVELQPDNAEAHYNLASAFREKELYTEAIKYYKKALEIKPDFIDAYNNLGLALIKNNETEKAIKYYKKALEIKPDFIDAYNNLGVALDENGETEEAVFYFKKTLEFDKSHIEALNNLGKALFDMAEFEQSIECYRKLLEIKPDYAEAHNNFGVVLNEIDYTDEAVKYFKKALEIKPDYLEVYLNLGKAFYNKGDVKESLKCYEKALEIKPDYAEAYNNLGTLLKENNEPEEAVKYYQKALEIKPAYADAMFGMSVMYLITGDFEKGWEYYEYRFQMSNKQRTKVPAFPMPKWNGSSLENKAIYVYYEQGLGDTLHFARYLPVLADMGAKVIFKPHAGLEELLRNSSLKAEIINNSNPDNIIKFDEHIPLLSIPRVLKANFDNIPAKTGYLKANPVKIAYYKEKYFNNNFFKVGIFWQGRKQHKNDRNRSTLLKYFYKLSQLENIKIYSFQKGYGVEQLDNLPDDIKIVNLGETFNDFSDTAAAMENLDLFITIDTSVAHLAAALGKKTWILLPFVAEWRWLTDKDESYWYESAKLFRQKEPGNWEELFERVIKNIKNMLN